MPDGQCLQKLVLFFYYLSSAYINGLWAAFGFVKAEGDFRPRGHFPKTRPPHIGYHAEFGPSALNDVGINTGEPPKLGSAVTPLS